MDICPACGDILDHGECWSCGYSEPYYEDEEEEDY